MKTLILNFIKINYLKIIVTLLIAGLVFISGWNCHKKLNPCEKREVYLQRDSNITKELKLKTDSIGYLQESIEQLNNENIKTKANAEAEKKYYSKLLEQYKKENASLSKKRVEIRYINIPRTDSAKIYCFDSVEMKMIDAELTERDLYKAQSDTCEKINVRIQKEIQLYKTSISMYQEVTKLQLQQIWKLENTPVSVIVEKPKWYVYPAMIILSGAVGYGIRAIQK